MVGATMRRAQRSSPVSTVSAPPTGSSATMGRSLTGTIGARVTLQMVSGEKIVGILESVGQDCSLIKDTAIVAIAHIESFTATTLPEDRPTPRPRRQS